jgi:hypothetical protein
MVTSFRWEDLRCLKETLPGACCLRRGFADLMRAGKIEFPTVTVEEIEDRGKADGFSKMIALGQTLWFIAQCLGRSAQHLDLTLIELLTLSLAVLNGVMYFLWWNKPLDVRCPVRVYVIGDLNEPTVPSKSIWEEGKFYSSLLGDW